MATVTVVSDLHLEARPLSFDEILDPDLKSDVLCLLGDIGDPSSPAYVEFLATCAGRFPTVLLLAGNNEYRNHGGGGRTMAQTEELIRQAAAAHPNVHFLQNATHILGDVAFIGTTLWSYLPDTPLPPPSEEEKPAAAAAVATINDRSSAGCGGAGGTAAFGDGSEAKEVRAVPVTPARAFREVGWVGGLPAAANTSGGAAVGLVGLDAPPPPAAASSLAPVAPEQQRQQQQQQEDLRANELAPAASALPVPEMASAAFQPALQQLQGGQWGFPVPISAPRRMAVVAGGGDGSCLKQAGGSAAAGRPAAPLPPPRFMSRSMQPSDWMMPDEGTLGISVAVGGGSVAGTTGSRLVCPPRRRLLRHCVSLASLRPDEPCPSWREVQGGLRHSRRHGGSGDGDPGASGGGSNSSSSRSGSSSESESDARGSEGGGSSSQSSDGGSDVEPASAESPYTSAEGCGRSLALSAEGGAAAAAATDKAAADGTLGRVSAPAGPYGAAGLSSFGDALVAAAAAAACTSSETVLAAAQGQWAVALPAARGLSPPAAGSVVSQTAGQLLSALPTFLSEPGLLASGGSCPTSKKTAASAAAAVGCTAPCVSAVAEPAPVVPAAASANGSVAEAATAPSPAPRDHHYHRHGHHHHHHRRHSHSHAAPPPPATVREFIGGTSLDYRRIFLAPGGPAITPDDTNALFSASLEFVRAAVAAARARGLAPVVLSHHAPSMGGTSRPAFAGHPSTHAYSTDLEPYLAGSGVAAWYCGHTHYNFDRELPSGVRLASNQFGSQPKPADGYSRTWQHRLPAGASGASTSGVDDGWAAVAARMVGGAAQARCNTASREGLRLGRNRSEWEAEFGGREVPRAVPADGAAAPLSARTGSVSMTAFAF